MPLPLWRTQLTAACGAPNIDELSLEVQVPAPKRQHLANTHSHDGKKKEADRTQGRKRH
jgi:hypothetical protein